MYLLKTYTKVPSCLGQTDLGCKEAWDYEIEKGRYKYEIQFRSYKTLEAANRELQRLIDLGYCSGIIYDCEMLFTNKSDNSVLDPNQFIEKEECFLTYGRKEDYEN